MSSSNPGEEAVPISPAEHIIQLVKEIQEELQVDGNTNITVKQALRGIILTVRKHQQQLADGLVGTIDRLESSLSGIAQSQKQQFNNLTKRLDKFENTKSWAQVAAKEALPLSLMNGTPRTSPSLASTVPAASPPDTRREDRDLIVNINKDASDQSESPPPTHAEVREQEKKALEQLNRALQGSKNCVLNDCRVGTVKKLPSGD